MVEKLENSFSTANQSKDQNLNLTNSMTNNKQWINSY